MNRIGPSLHDELEEAGLLGILVAVSADLVTPVANGQVYVWAEGVTDDQKQAVMDVISAHNPAKPSKSSIRLDRENKIQKQAGMALLLLTRCFLYGTTGREAALRSLETKLVEWINGQGRR